MSDRNTVHVSGFPAGTRANELAPQFENVGRLVRIDIPPLGRFKSIPYAFVEYESSHDAENAIRSCDGTPFEMNKSFSLRVQFARSKPRRDFGDSRDPRDGMRQRDYRDRRDPRDRDPRDYRDPRDRMRSYRDQDDRRGGPGQGVRGYDDRRSGNPRPYGPPRMSGSAQPPRRYDERLGEPKPYEPVLGTPISLERKLRDPPVQVSKATEQNNEQEQEQKQEQKQETDPVQDAGNESDGSNYDPNENLTVAEAAVPKPDDTSAKPEEHQQEQEQEHEETKPPFDALNQPTENVSEQEQ